MSERSIVYMNGKWVAEADAKIGVLSVSVKYGLNVFEGIRGYLAAGGGGLAIFRLTEHLQRLVQSMTLMGYGDIPSIDDLAQIVKEAVTRNRPKTDVHIRLAAYILSDGFLDAKGPVGLMCAVVPATSRSPQERAVTAVTSSWRKISDQNLPARIKNGANYSNSRLALIEARRNGYDEAILLNENGKVAEAAAACLFLVRDGTLITPSVTQSILESITRDTLIRLGRRQANLAIEEREVDRTELMCATEAFIAGSSYEITPVRSFDRINMSGGAPGPISTRLADVYMRTVRGELKEYRDWLTPIGGVD